MTLMTLMTLIKLFLLIMLAMTNSPESKSLAQASEKQSTCGIRRQGTFDMMLTCYFHQNISALQRDFTVYLYRGEPSPKTVLECEWSPNITCTVAPGYKYEYDIDVNHDHTNVRIINAGAEHVGMYTCQMIGEINFGTCNLTEEQLPPNSTLTPNTQLMSTTVPAQTTTTSLLPDDRQTQSADERSSTAYKLSTSKGESLAEEQKQENNTVVVVVPSVVVAVLLNVIIIVVIFALCRRRQRKSSRTDHEGSDERRRPENKTLLNQSQQDEHHRNISPPKVEDCETTDSQLTVQEDRQHKPFTENPAETDEEAVVARADNHINRQQQTSRHSEDTRVCSPAARSVQCGCQHVPEVKTRCNKDGDCCLEADTKRLVTVSLEPVEKAGIQERGDVDVEDVETSFDGRQPELQQRNSHIDAPKKLNKEEEEDPLVTQSALTTGHVNVGAV